MSQKDNILDELAGLNSSLGMINHESFQVPAGYFEGLPAMVLARIKAMETTDPRKELEILSPYLSTLSKVNPYAVPSGYFDALDTSFVTVDDDKELAGLSTLLVGLKKEMPYSVPQGYFDEISTPVKTKSRVISFGWVRYAAAAVITGLIVLAAFYFRTSEKEPGVKVLAKVTRDVKKMNEVQKDNLLDFIDAGLSGEESAQVSADKKSEIKSLIQGVPDEELKDFQEQTEDIQDVLMTN